MYTFNASNSANGHENRRGDATMIGMD
jgi:hypothetical protein